MECFCFFLRSSSVLSEADRISAATTAVPLLFTYDPAWGIFRHWVKITGCMYSKKTERSFSKGRLFTRYDDSRLSWYFRSLQERIALAEASCACEDGLDNVTVEGFCGLLCDFARAHGVTVSVRGARAVSDFEYEFQMAGMNRTLMPEVETIFLMPALNCQFVSGSFVREIAALGGDVSGFVPQPVRCALQQRFIQHKAQR